MSSLPQSGLTALAWTFTAAATVLTVGRFAIRYVIRNATFRSLQIDDIFHGLACLVLIGYIITYTIAFPLNYKVEFFEAGLSTIEPTLAELDHYFHLIIAVSATFWIINYLVKFSFLTFYRTLFGVSREFMRAWWCVLAFTIVTFMANFISVFWACGTPRDLFIVSKCVSPKAVAVSARIVTMWCVLNVISDVIIMILPLWMLKGLQMQRGQKIGLALLFLVATVDIIFDIMRTIYTVHGGAIALDTIWDILEPTIMVIISSLPTYRSLLGNSHKKSTAYRNLDYKGTITSNSKTSNYQEHELSSQL